MNLQQCGALSPEFRRTDVHFFRCNVARAISLKQAHRSLCFSTPLSLLRIHNEHNIEVCVESERLRKLWFFGGTNTACRHARLDFDLQSWCSWHMVDLSLVEFHTSRFGHHTAKMMWSSARGHCASSFWVLTLMVWWSVPGAVVLGDSDGTHVAPPSDDKNINTAAGSSRSFDVVWNSPWPTACPVDTINPQPDFERYGVRTNGHNATFNGNVVHTIYCGGGNNDFFNSFPVS